MPFTQGDKNAGSKGKSNNLKNKPWRDTIDRAIKQSDGKALRRAAEALLERAGEGDVAAIKELGDRVDGKVKNEIEGTIDSNLTVVIEKIPDE